jgi:hypothetical protein
VPPGNVRSTGEVFLKHFAGQVRMDHAPGRIGFMSTQRRENRWQRTSCTECGFLDWRFVPDGEQRAGPHGESSPGPFARQDGAIANGGTAPPGYHPPIDMNLSLGIPAWLATNSLHLDCRIVELVRLVCLARQDEGRGSPPLGAGRCASAGTRRFTEHSYCPPPTLPVSPGFHPSLPQVPAG